MLLLTLPMHSQMSDENAPSGEKEQPKVGGAVAGEQEEDGPVQQGQLEANGQTTPVSHTSER